MARGEVEDCWGFERWAFVRANERIVGGRGWGGWGGVKFTLEEKYKLIIDVVGGAANQYTLFQHGAHSRKSNLVPRAFWRAGKKALGTRLKKRAAKSNLITRQRGPTLFPVTFTACWMIVMSQNC